MKKTRKQTFIVTVAIVSLCFGVTASAHNDEHHGHVEKKTDVVSDTEEQTLRKINEEYITQVKPIFQISCMNCHSPNTKYPWYHVIPGAKHLIDHDVRESKVHLDMTNDFPFRGHGSPEEDLEAIKKAINDKTMPPFRYRALHWSSALKPEDVKTIYAWIEKSLQALQPNQENK